MNCYLICYVQVSTTGSQNYKTEILEKQKMEVKLQPNGKVKWSSLERCNHLLELEGLGSSCPSSAGGSGLTSVTAPRINWREKNATVKTAFS